jgi:tRNA dimethylallyltransferase
MNDPRRASLAASPSPDLMLAGPTGIGKTALAVALAERHGLEIVSADSMQVYRGMEIGTAQPTPDERKRARFHVCGQVDPFDPFDARRFLDLCDAARADILARGRRPLYVGGTGLYLRALRWGLSRDAVHAPAIRHRLEEEARRFGPAALHARLAQVDPVAAARIAAADANRVARALEVFEATGRPISQLQGEWLDPTPRFPHVLAILEMDSTALERRIAARVDAMLRQGWIEETQALLARGVPRARHCLKALGYRSIIDYLDGRLDLGQLRGQVILKTRQFAKRQRTWFRRERPATLVPIDAECPHEALAALEKLLELHSEPSL